MSIVWSIDIETVSQGKRANEYTDKASYALGNVKDPIKIEAKLKEKREEARNKHALHWGTGKIVSVAMVDVFGDSGNNVHMGHDEKQILSALSCDLDSYCKIIGKTSDNFDWPFLVGRYMANNMPVPSVFKRKFASLDVDKFFGFSSASGQRGKLDLYAHALGIDMKPMHGNQVGKLYADICLAEMNKDEVAARAGWKQLHDYNLHDAQVVAEMARLYYRDESEVLGD